MQKGCRRDKIAKHCGVHMHGIDIMTSYLDPVSQSSFAKLLLETLFDLDHVTFAARYNNADEGLVVSSEAFHCFLQFLGKISRLVSDHLDWRSVTKIHKII